MSIYSFRGGKFIVSFKSIPILINTIRFTVICGDGMAVVRVTRGIIRYTGVVRAWINLRL